MSSIEKLTATITAATEYKAAGSAFLKEGNIAGAIRQYHYGHLQTKSVIGGDQYGAMMGGAKAPDDPKLKAEVLKLHRDLLNNLALCHWKNALTLQKAGEKEKALERFGKVVIKEDENNVKALLRRAQANWELNNLGASENDNELLLTLSIDDGQRKIAEGLKRKIDARNKVYAKQQAQAFKGMFDAK